MNKNIKTREEKDVYFQYLNDISKYPLLTKEQEKVLLKKVHEGNRAALEMLVNSNLRFVVNIANLYKGQGLEVGELISEGNMGLIEAARRFDYNQKIKFISYAVWWVRQNMTRAIAEKGRMVRISAEKELVLRRFAKKGGQMKQVIGGGLVMDPKSLEGVSKYKAKDIEKILMMGNRTASLDAPMGDDGDITLGETICTAEMASDMAESRNRSEVYNKVLNENLSDLETKVLRLYYGMESDADLNLKDIATMTGHSKERIRQLKENALEKLRNSQVERLLNDAA